MKAELSVYDKLYDKDPSLNYLEHPLHKIVKLVLNTYWFDFLEKEININIENCKEKVLIDYESFLASLVHVVENTLKYSLPKTDLNIRIKTNKSNITLTFDMISLKISQTDLNNMYDEGYSGELPRRLNKNGKGIGMYMVKRLADISNFGINVVANFDENKSISEKGILYENNLFIFELPILE